MAQRLEVYRGGDGAKMTTKGPKKVKNQKKGNVVQVEGSSSRGTVQVVQAVRKQQKKGKGGSGSGGKKVKRGGRKKVQCHNCGGNHFLRDCKEWKEIKEILRSSSGKRVARPPSPIRTGHRDGTLGQAVEDREGCDRGMSQQDVDDRGDHKVGIKAGETGDLEVK